MSEDSDDQKIVRVASASIEAYESPHFILKVGEKYFVTLAVWEYDKRHATTDRDRHGCDEIAELFNKLSKEGHTAPAVLVPARFYVMEAGHTPPRPPRLDPKQAGS